MPALIIIVVVGAIGILSYFQIKKTNQFIAEGKMIKRNISFMEYTETFSLNMPESVNLDDEVKKLLTPEMRTGHGTSESGAHVFQGPTWRAVLKQNDTEEGTAYDFRFIKWETHKGIPKNHLEMNLLLTAVEKMFLQFDPNTKVTTTLNKINKK